MTKNYFKKYQNEVFFDIYDNPLLEVTQRGGEDPDSAYLAQVKDQLPKSLVDFYQSCDGIHIEWQAKETTGIHALGSIRLLQLKHLFDGNEIDLAANEFGGWRLNTDYGNLQPLKGAFRIVDLFSGKSMAGIFSEEPATEEVFLYNSGVAFESLKVDFEGYFQLLCKAYGFLGWQRVIIHKEYGQNGGYGEYEHDDFRDTMPLLFPDFNFDEFIELYESLKIVD